MFKTSMFNIILEDSDELILFNSFTGFESLTRVKKENKEKVIKLLNENMIEKEDSEVFRFLYENGYIIDSDCDEKKKREMLYYDVFKSDMLRLIILPTEQCNFRCKYCYESFERGKMKEDIQDALVKYVKKNISYYQGLRVSWFGGEPLLALDVIKNLSEKFINICKRTKKKYLADMTTNGYLLNLNTFKELLKYHVRSVYKELHADRETGC